MMGKSRKVISMAPRRNVCVKTLLVLFFLSAVISLTNCAKLSRSNHHDSRRGDGDAGDSSLETLLLRDKLNLILDAESREVTLLKNLLDESHEHEEEASSTSSAGGSSRSSVDKSSEKNELDKSYKSQSDSWTTATSSPTTSTTISDLPPSTSTLMTVPPPVEKKAVGKQNTHSLEYLREHGIVNKLEENSKRMEKMVVFLVDLRNLLTEALTSQNRQMAFESEMVEIREEMEYLRKELQTLKKEKRSMFSSSSSPSGGTMLTSGGAHSINLENKLHNEEATIEWLKESTQDLRKQMKEISESCNITVMVQMKEQMNKENGRRNADLAAAQRSIESLHLKQLRQDEQIFEAKTNIEDLRSWQVKMGQKLIENKSTTTDTTFSSQFPHDEDDEQDGSSNDVNQERSNSIEFGGEEHFITEALKESAGKPFRHGNKRLKAKVHELQTIIQDLVKDNKNYQRRLVKIENSQRSLKSIASNLRETLSQAGLINGGATLTNEVHRRGNNDANLNENSNNGNGRLSKRMGSLEKTMQEYVITLENLNDKVGAVEELQESSAQLFRALESLETKYDERVADLQTGLARLESSTSSMHVANEDLKEQQTQQSGQMQNIKKELFQMKGKLQTNHLRLASIQSQMVKWASQKCSDENYESIQNIRIATLEHAILDLQTPSSTSTISK